MQGKNVFDPEKIILIEFKMKKGQVDTPENFDVDKVRGHQLKKTFQLAFNIEEKLAKAEFNVSLNTVSKGENETEAKGVFHLIFIYGIENLEELVMEGKNKRMNVDPTLANALSAVTYSTSRGILLTRLQGTALQDFVLPIINPNELFRDK